MHPDSIGRTLLKIALTAKMRIADAHKHFHLHPLIANDIIAIGRRHGMGAMRVPYEPAAVLAEVEPRARGFPGYVAPWTRLLARRVRRSEEHTSELQSRQYLVCRLLLEKKKKNNDVRQNLVHGRRLTAAE